MAKNLHAKIPPTDTLLIRDVNEESTARFLREAGETAKSSGASDTMPNVIVAESARDIAEQSVSSACLLVAL
jgi:3-hydroxyisobutyrate dehydrogenase